MQRVHSKLEHRIDAADVAVAVLRAVVGVVLMAHGYLKLTDIGEFERSLASLGVPLPAISSWLAALAEFLGGMGLFFGFFTRLTALAPAIVMLTAILTVHAGNGLIAQKGGFELPLVLLTVLLFFVVAGPGPLSMDAALGGLYEKHRDVRPKGDPPNDRQVPAEV